MKHLFFSFILILALGFGCNKKDRFKVNTNEIELEIKFEKFYEAFHSTDTSNIISEVKKLNKAYPSFFPLYCNRLIRIGSPTMPYFNSALMRFLSDSIYQQVADTVVNTFSDLSKEENAIRNGFKRFKYFFPDKTRPNIFYLISGFNESITTAPEMLGISLENYLGQNHTFYKWLGIYEYQRNNMYREKIPSDVLWAWLITEFPIGKQDNLLSQMIYDGKILFTLQQLLPDEPEFRLLGFTPDQYNWCETNEASMWNYIIEYKHLFSTDPTVIKKYCDAAPFTQYFGNNSAPKSGSYLGLKIIQSFMGNHKEMTLYDLLYLNNSQQILEQSRYRPD